jgi:branched-chain amino acid transport system ATP-binding protein
MKKLFRLTWEERLVLELKKVSTYYGHVQALKEVSFVVKLGEIVTIIGSNGAGKSTTLRTISGLLAPKCGEIYWEGKRIDGLAAYKIVERGISHIPEGRQLFSSMTVLENLQLGAYKALKRSQLDNSIEEVTEFFPWIKERLNQPAGTLSGGEQQMLAIARALMASPKLLLLDEPSMGLAPKIIQDIFIIIKELNKKGLTILLIEQDAQIALSVADRGYVMQTGSIVLEGTGAELLANEDVKSIYLGQWKRKGEQ